MNELRMGFKQAILQRMQTFESSSTINSKSGAGSPGLPRTTTSVSPPTMQPAQITDFSINRILGEVPKVVATNKKSTPHVAAPKCTNTLNDSILDLSKTSTSDIPPTAAAPYSATYAAFHQDFLAAAAAANATKFYAQFFPHIFPSAAYPYPHHVTAKRYFAPYVLSTATRATYRYPATAAATNLPSSTVTTPSAADLLVRPKVCPRDCTDCVVYYNQFSSKNLNYGTAVSSATSGSISPYQKTKCVGGELSLDASTTNSSVISSKSIRNMSGKISKLHLQVGDKSPSASPQSAVFNAEEISYKCRICDKVFGCSQTLQAHERTHKSPRYECTDCGKGFSQLRNYKYHLSVHRGTKEFAAECPECGKTFNDKGYLSSHMKIHRNKKEYECPYCPKSFNQRVAFNMHVRIHTGVKPHKCVECGKRFSRKMLLKQHMRTHSGEKPYQCSVCGKSFADRSNMTLHHRLHSGIKPFNCPICPKAFTKKHHLKTHLNYHTGCKPYVCPHPNCNQAFTQSSNMRTHAKKCQYRPLQLVFPASSTSTMDGKTQSTVSTAAAAAAAITTTATMANNFTALCLPHTTTMSSSSSSSSSALSAGIRMFSSSSFNAVQTQLPPAQQQLMASLRPF